MRVDSHSSKRESDIFTKNLEYREEKEKILQNLEFRAEKAESTLRCFVEYLKLCIIFANFGTFC